VLHHCGIPRLENAFRKIFNSPPGGSVWITDLVSHEMGGVQDLMWNATGLPESWGRAIPTKVFDYIDREDSPRPAAYQLELLRRVGFSEVELLHKNSCLLRSAEKKAVFNVLQSVILTPARKMLAVWSLVAPRYSFFWSAASPL